MIKKSSHHYKIFKINDIQQLLTTYYIIKTSTLNNLSYYKFSVFFYYLCIPGRQFDTIYIIIWLDL